MSSLKLVEAPRSPRDADPRKWTPEHVSEFLDEVKGISNNDRITRVGKFLSARFKHTVPTGETLWVWDRYDHSGKPMSTIPKVISDTQTAAALAPGVIAPSDRLMGAVEAQMSRTRHNTYQVEGQYTLTVNGVVLQFAWGGQENVANDQLGNQIVTVTPEKQNFRGRNKYVNASFEEAYYFFLWMHPDNFDCPARMDPDAKAAAGVSVGMNTWYVNRVPKLRCNMGKRLEIDREKKNADVVRLTSEFASLTTPKLRELAKSVGFNGLSLMGVEEERHKDKYLSFLFDAVASGGDDVVAKLRTLIHGGSKHTERLVNDAFSVGILEFNDNEFFFVSKDGALSQPGTLVAYMCPPGMADTDAEAAAWLSYNMMERRDDKLVATIEGLLGERINSPDGKAGNLDWAGPMVDRAIKDGTVEPNHKTKWWTRKSDGENLVKFKPDAKDDERRATLIKYAAAFSQEGAYSSLGLPVED